MTDEALFRMLLHMPTAADYHQLVQDLNDRKAAVEGAYGRVETWLYELDLTPELMAELGALLGAAGERKATASTQVDTLIGIAEARELRCRTLSDEWYVWKWSTGNGYSADPDKEPKPGPNEGWLEIDK